jgi:signal transduction histidine kinase
VLAELKPQILEKKMVIEENYDPSIPILQLDPKLIRIVIQNLLTNALKYTPAKGKVSISIQVSGNDIALQVSDNGYGIPQSQQPQIFSKLFRADNVKQKETEGTGLGLYIVKSIVEQAGGKIWFKSAENQGTTFYATIPMKGMEKKEGSKRLD